MSKKNLARTAIEGGRANGNKWERRNSHAEQRAASRDFCNKIKLDPEFGEDESIEVIDKVYQAFTDKLSPMFRWLRSKVGSSWADVRSEITEKFDARTTAGRHILFDHLLSSVIDTQSGFDERGFIVDPAIDAIKAHPGPRYTYRRFHEFYVDQQGILCETPKRKRTYERITEQDYFIAGQWLNGRMIINKGGVLSWVLPVDGIWKSSWFDPNQNVYDAYKAKLKYYLLDNGPFQLVSTIYFYGSPSLQYTGKSHGDHWEEVENPFSFRQRGPLSEADIKEFKSFKKGIQNQILAYSKGR